MSIRTCHKCGQQFIGGHNCPMNAKPPASVSAHEPSPQVSAVPVVERVASVMTIQADSTTGTDAGLHEVARRKPAASSRGDGGEG